MTADYTNAGQFQGGTAHPSAEREAPPKNIKQRVQSSKKARQVSAKLDAHRRVTEAQVHKAVAAYLARALPPDAWFTTIGHGGGGKVRGAQLKGRGVKPGVPDILVVYQGEAWFIELKRPKGKRSADQVLCHGDLEDAGARVAICHSADEVERFITLTIGIRTRARVAA